MDLTTALGLAAGAAVVLTLILLGGDLRTFYDIHAIIVIFGGSFAATLIRFPLASILHGVPLGIKYAFTMRRMTQRDLVDEIARLAEISRKLGPLALEKEIVTDEFLATGVRYVADGYDANFIREALRSERETFLTHLDEGQKIYRAVGDCAPAFGMVGKLNDEEVNRTLIIDGVMMLRESKSPQIVREMLLAYIPEQHRPEPEAV